MFCFIAGEDTEKERIILTYQDKQLYFTLDKETEFGKHFYEKIKKDGSLKLPMYKAVAEGYYKDLRIDVLNDYFDVYKTQGTGKFTPGDIAYDSGTVSSLYFVLQEYGYLDSHQKVGEMEESSIEGFESLLSLMGAKGQEKIVTFTVEEPERSGYSLIIICVIATMVLSFILFIIIIYKLLF